MKNIKHKYMNRRQRKALLSLHGITMTNIARAIGCNPKTVSTIVCRYPEKKSRRIQEYIAAHTGKTFAQIWGTIPDGRTLKRKIRSKHIPTIAENIETVNDENKKTFVV